MAQHIKILGILHIIHSGLVAFAGVLVLVIMGGLAGFIGASDHTQDSAVAAPLLGGIGLFVCLLLVILALPGLIGGIFLMQYRPWARILIIVVSALDLLSIPIGTALGIYGFWVLLKPETEALFNRPPLPAGQAY